jgi:hypothetical protein
MTTRPAPLKVAEPTEVSGELPQFRLVAVIVFVVLMVPVLKFKPATVTSAGTVTLALVTVTLSSGKGTPGGSQLSASNQSLETLPTQSLSAA